MKMTESEAEEHYNEYLDEFDLKTLIGHIPTGKILKELDPIQYDCGFADFCDAEDIEIE